jgi:hypothetical protein
MVVSWRRFLPGLAAAALLIGHLVASGVVADNRLALRVVHQLAPAQWVAAETGFRSEVREALGLVARPAPPPRDPDLMASLADRAEGAGGVWRLAVSYALLTSSRPELPSQAHRFDLPTGDARGATEAVWLGRAAWSRGDRNAAVRYWRTAFGERPLYRRRLAEALYINRESGLAITELVAMLFVPACDLACRDGGLETLRYWILWDGQSDKLVREMCDIVLTGIQWNSRDAAIDRGVANILARRSATFDWPQADADLTRAESIDNTSYVRATRAFLTARTGDVETARAAALQVATEPEGDGHALILAGQTLAFTGDRAAARKAWSLAIEVAPLLESIARGLLGAYPAS